jgi:hypothetical protein
LMICFYSYVNLQPFNEEATIKTAYAYEQATERYKRKPEL